MPALAISARGLRKSYGSIEAVRGVDLSIERGEVFSLLGPNGAGKTTTVEILEGHRARDGGEVDVLGFDPERGERALKERIGIVLQSPGVEPYLTVEESIDQYRGYYPAPRATDELLELVGLTEQRGQRVRRLSGGQQRRLDVAIGLAGDPELLFLDEPTTGFDPSARRQAWGMVRGLRALGKTVVLTTHYMDEAEALADRVAIIARGAIVAEGTPRALMAGDAGTRISFRLPPGQAGMLDGVPGVPGVPGAAGVTVAADGSVSLRVDDPTATLHALTGRAIDQGIVLAELSVTHASLEDVYLQLTAGDGAGGSPSGAAQAGL